MAGKRHHKAHSHGHGKLFLATSENGFEVEIKLPGVDIVGFEHQPHSKEEKRKVQSAVEFFKNSKSNVVLSQASGCSPEGEAKVKTSLAENRKHNHGHQHQKSKSHKSEHAEFQISYKFKCSKIVELKFLKLLIFEKYSRLESIKAEAVTETGQFSATLSRSSSLFLLDR